MKQGSKAFFSEEKKQKTFISALYPPLRPWPASQPQPKKSKVFWFFSSEKNILPYVGGQSAAPFLLVLCHGLGADGRQLASLGAQLRETCPEAALFLADAPKLRRGAFWLPQGRKWFDNNRPRDLQVAEAARSAAWLNARVDAELIRRNLPAGAVLFCGFSQGAMVCLLAGLQRTVAPLGIVAMAGSLMVRPGEFLPRSRPPVLLVHGAADVIVPPRRSEEAASRLRDAGVPVELEILPGLGHIIVADAAPAAAAFIAGICA
jgi:phospholipase/carboxylesterase